MVQLTINALMAKKPYLCRIAMVLGFMVLNQFSLFGADMPYKFNRDTSFFAVNQKFPMHFGVKSWGRVQLGISNLMKTGVPDLGWEFAIGPFFEWQFLNGLGIQTGLLYNCQELFFMSFLVSEKKIGKQASVKEEKTFKQVIESIKQEAKDPEWKMLRANLKSAYEAKAGLMFLHNISIPFLFRFYPEKSRQFVLYIGPRFEITLSAKRKIQFLDINVQPDDKYDLIAKGFGAVFSKLFTGPRNLSDKSAQVSQSWFKQKKLFHWDFGFEFNGKSGFIMGINQIGIVLGYDGTRLFCNK